MNGYATLLIYSYIKLAIMLEFHLLGICKKQSDMGNIGRDGFEAFGASNGNESM